MMPGSISRDITKLQREAFRAARALGGDSGPIEALVARESGLSDLEKRLLTDAIRWLCATARLSRLKPPECIGLATGTEGWWPAGDYWPEGVPREWTITGLIRALESLGWESTDSPEREPYKEKICVIRGPAFTRAHPAGMYVGCGSPSHVVRQLDDGRWASKVAFLDELSFSWEELHVGAFRTLGEPAVIMARYITPGRRCE